MPSPVLTTVADLKVFLGISASETGEDVRLNAMLCGVERSIQKMLGRTFASDSYTHYFDGSGRETLYLRQRPLTAISTVRIDAGGFGGYGTDAFNSNTVQTIGEDFIPQSLEETEGNEGSLIAINGVWPVGQKNIKVGYTAGYITIPQDLINAIHAITGEVWTMAGKGGKVQSETLGQYSYELAVGESLKGTDAEIATARETLSRYRSILF